MRILNNRFSKFLVFTAIFLLSFTNLAQALQMPEVLGSSTPAFVQSANHLVYSGTSATATFSSGVTVGDLIVVAVAAGNSISGITSTCVTGNLTVASSWGSGGSFYYAAMAYGFANASGSCSVTATVSASGIIEVLAHEVSGISASSPLDGQTYAMVGYGSTASPSSGNITTTQSGDYIFGFSQNNSEVAISSAGSGFTQRVNNGSQAYTEDQIQASAGAIAATFNMASSGASFNVGVMAFKAASGGGSGDTQAPTVPTGLTATAVSSSGINLSWSASTDNVGVTGYDVYRCGGSGCTPSSPAITQVTSGTSYSDTNLTASTQYTYTVDAYDAAGNHSAQSSSATAATQASSLTSPSISSFTANPSTITSGNSSTLSWTVSGNPAPTLSINNGIGTVSGSSVNVSPTATTTYALTATNSQGNATASTTITVTIADTQPPTVPTNLTATAVSSSGINLSWTASTDNVGVTGYKVYRCTGSSCTPSQIGTSATNSYSDANLAASTQYTYTVSAYDAAGNNSAQSTSASATTQAQQQTGTYPWSGIIAPSRATDWSGAGIPGGIPSANWTQCGSTIAAYGASSTPASPATINNAITACGSDQYVLLGAGQFYLSGVINLKSNVVLRGMGANQTFLHFPDRNTSSCNGWGGNICMVGSNTYSGGGYTQANWTGGYTQGTRQIILDNVTGIVPNLTPIVLDQCDTGFTGTAGSVNCTGSAADNGNIYICQTTAVCSSQSSANISRPNRGQEEVVTATIIMGTGPYTVTISDPLRNPNWSAGQTPEAWWGSQTITNAGVENLYIDSSASDNSSIVMATTNKTWVKGVASYYSNNYHVKNTLSVNTEVVDNYFYWTTTAATQSYGSGGGVAGDALIANNIAQGVADPVNFDGPCSGCVAAYNFSVNNYFSLQTLYQFQTVSFHAAGESYILSEGNLGSNTDIDDVHGTHDLLTFFRNYFNGYETDNGTNPTDNVSAFYVGAFSRYVNAVGNVLGTAGFHNLYQCSAASSSGNCLPNSALPHDIWDVGYSGNTYGLQDVSTPPSPDDPLTASTFMRWGNWDTVNGQTQWNASEVPSGLSLYANPVPSTQTLPASFIFSSKPSFWPSTIPWPAVGPDVTGGNIYQCTSGTYKWSLVTQPSQCAGGTSNASVVGGHAYATPTMSCYLNVMSGTPDGTGGMDSFNPASCYPGDFTSSGSQGSAPTISSFSASPSSITSGGSATLSWNITGATSVSIDNSVGSQSSLTTGSVSVSPTQTTTYTLTATNSNGSVTSQATVTVSLAPDTTPPTATITSPSAGTVSGTITFSATASDPTVTGQVTSGLKSLTLYVDGSVFATSTTGSITSSLNTTTLSNGSHSLTATAIDNAGNSFTTTAVSITVNNAVATKYPRIIALTSLEGIAAIPSNTTITATILSPSSGSTLETQSNLTPTAGSYTVTFLSSDPQLVNIRIKVNGYLSQLLTSVDTTVNSGSALTVPELSAGDLNNDNVINSLDYSLMNSNWLKSGVGDINGDGIVNSLDFAILKNNFNKAGQ
jgi:fibronectin type 3 domain-containing protein